MTAQTRSQDRRFQAGDCVTVVNDILIIIIVYTFFIWFYTDVILPLGTSLTSPDSRAKKAAGKGVFLLQPCK